MSLTCTIFHLRGSVDEGRQLLGRTRGGGTILAHNETWTSMLVELDTFPDGETRLIARSDFAEDLGLWVQFLQNGRVEAALEFVWCRADGDVHNGSPAAKLKPGLCEWLVEQQLMTSAKCGALISLAMSFPRTNAQPATISEAAGTLFNFPVICGRFGPDADELKQLLPSAEDVEGT